jgi:hypothetical protein
MDTAYCGQCDVENEVWPEYTLFYENLYIELQKLTICIFEMLAIHSYFEWCKVVRYQMDMKKSPFSRFLR